MFNNNEEKKLDWMYQGPNSMVDREEYLLGRTVDKSLEQLNDEEKRKSTNIQAPSKNHVEHECIPPSIRDYNKIVQDEQVDIQAKLQEDPLVLIKKQEDESRRQFLQNPIQLKKLQEAMEAQLKGKKLYEGKRNIDKKLKKKLSLLNEHLNKKGYKNFPVMKEFKDEEILDTILMHKFNYLKTKLSEVDLRNILMENFSDNEESNDDSKHYFKALDLREVDKDVIKEKSGVMKPKDYCSLNKFKKEYENKSIKQKNKHESKGDQYKKKKLTEKEKELLRQNMMKSAECRSKETVRNYEQYKKDQEKQELLTHHGEEFMRKELLKSANSSSVADRIRANLNNIQRSRSAMETF